MCEACNIATNTEQEFKVIRRSHLELYAMCPYALYLQLVKGVEPEMNEYAELGIMIHHTLDMLSNQIIEDNVAITELASGIETVFKDNEKLEDFLATGNKCLESFLQLRPLLYPNFVTEKNIIFSLGDNLPKVSCTLDRIDFVGDDIFIADWKTGKPMAGKKLITDLQPPLYIEAIHQEYGVYPKTFTLYYLAHDKIKVYTLQENGNYIVDTGRNKYELDIPEALDRTREILKKINNRNWTMPKDVSPWYCKNMCSHYKTGICASSSKEQWKVLNEKYSAE